MKRASTQFLQAVLILIGILVLTLLIRFPLTEGRAENLDLFHIYFDPFILYGYASSSVFFIALYKAHRLLGYIGHNKAFTTNSVKALRDIKFCAILMGVLIVIAGLIIVLFHNKEDDPAGFLAMCILTTFISITIAIITSVFQNIIQKGVDLQTENEYLNHTSEE